MGIKQEINSRDLPLKYRDLKLVPTKDGVISSVYFLGDDLVLKLFTKETPLWKIENEIRLIQELKGLPTPKIVDSFIINTQRVLIYKKVLGESLKRVKLNNIKQIAKFLKKFHKQSGYMRLHFPIKEYSNSHLKKMIRATNSSKFYRAYYLYKIELKEDGIIHGDLFLDNCKFVNGSLSGVYDFSDSNLGDFHFDLAVVALSWCFERSGLDIVKVETLLSSYGSSISIEEFLNYIRYALLFYATKRYLANRNYQELLERLKRV